MCVHYCYVFTSRNFHAVNAGSPPEKQDSKICCDVMPACVALRECEGLGKVDMNAP